MLALFIKISAFIFFAVVSIDAFYKMKKVRIDMENELVSPKMGRIFRKRHLRTGIVFAVLALASVAAFFIRIAPLGE
jgi:4-hydroxybenzoate polyprenyltransferase